MRSASWRALTGIYGLSLLAVLLGALPAALLEPGGRARWRPAAAGAAAARPGLVGGALRLADAAVAGGRRASALRLVQGNVAAAGQVAAGAARRTGSAAISSLVRRVTRRGITPRRSGRNPRAPYPLEQDARGARADRAGGAAGRPAADRRRALRFQPASRRAPGTACSSLDDGRHASWRTTTSATWCRSASSCRCATCSAASGSASSPRGSLDFQAGPGAGPRSRCRACRRSAR